MTEPVPALEPASLKSLLDGAFQKTRKHFKTTLLGFGVPVALVWAVIPLVQLGLMPTAGAIPANPFANMLFSFAITAFTLLVFSVLWCAVSVFANKTLAGETVTGGEAWLSAISPRLLGTNLLVALAIVVGAMCCIVPGIYVGLILTAVLPVMVRERRFGVDAFARSHALMTHNPQGGFGTDPRVRSFLISFTAALVGYAVSFIVQLPLMVVMFVVMFRSTSSGRAFDPNTFMRDLVWLQVPSNAVGMLLQTLVLQYTAFGIAALYTDVRNRKEGTDLVEAAERMSPLEPIG